MRRVSPIYKCTCWQSILTELKTSKQFLTREWRIFAELTTSKLTPWQILSTRWDIFDPYSSMLWFDSTGCRCGVIDVSLFYLILHFSTASLSVRWSEEWKIWSTLLTSMQWPTSSIPSTSWTKPAWTLTAWTPASAPPEGPQCRWEETKAVRTSRLSPPGLTWPAWVRRENLRPSGPFLTTWQCLGELTSNSSLIR